MSKTSQTHCGQGWLPEGDAVPARFSATRGGARKGLRFSLLVFLGFVLGISQNSALARPKQVELRWGDLSPLIVDQRVRLHLPEDVRIKGRVLSVRDDGLYMNIKKRSNKKAYPKGLTVIPRADVSLIELRKKRGIKYRAILTSTGAVLALGLAVASTAYAGGDDAPTDASFVLVSAAGGALGYLIGDALDTKVMHIKVVGDPPQTETTVNSPAQP